MDAQFQYLQQSTTLHCATQFCVYWVPGGRAAQVLCRGSSGFVHGGTADLLSLGVLRSNHDVNTVDRYLQHRQFHSTLRLKTMEEKNSNFLKIMMSGPWRLRIVPDVCLQLDSIHKVTEFIEQAVFALPHMPRVIALGMLMRYPALITNKHAASYPLNSATQDLDAFVAHSMGELKIQWPNLRSGYGQMHTLLTDSSLAEARSIFGNLDELFQICDQKCTSGRPEANAAIASCTLGDISTPLAVEQQIREHNNEAQARKAMRKLDSLLAANINEDLILMALNRKQTSMGLAPTKAEALFGTRSSALSSSR